ncbi:hypothetical protein TcWFU_009712 [Taenia crassiceps]|uniref:Uncharacterized protein n=1 Tax=Taenia crassiceps TaxID=6207 RepID=A0ABR4QEK3_9CEST
MHRLVCLSYLTDTFFTPISKYQPPNATVLAYSLVVCLASLNWWAQTPCAAVLYFGIGTTSGGPSEELDWCVGIIQK